ncbi:hypothetical protein ACFU1R_06515 [Priestia megaterium]|uniref:hypothetical protein n=1 Tax=Priestia megaterium TaxID=1404 RepID=UPI003672D63D
MANNENKSKAKKKPSNQQHKTVYFNTHNVNDVQLYKYAQSVGVRNFSGWVKSLIYQEMVRRNGAPPNPYEYASVPAMEVEQQESVEVPVRSIQAKSQGQSIKLKPKQETAPEQPTKPVVEEAEVVEEKPKVKEEEPAVQEVNNTDESNEEVVVDANSEGSSGDEIDISRTNRAAKARGMLGNRARR